MHVTMVKKRLENGEACRKCQQAEDLLRTRGLWERIDEVVWALEGEPESPGMQLGARHGVDTAPFFIVEGDGEPRVYRAVLRLIKDLTASSAPERAGALLSTQDLAAAEQELTAKPPSDVLRFALERFGTDCAIAFSGAEDVVLLHMAARTGLPFSAFCLDTGRLHPETYRFIDKVRSHYGIEIRLMAPDAAELEPFVRKKGLFSFYEDGHEECCAIRKVAPLRRVLSEHLAWVTGQRRDQSPATRSDIAVVEVDRTFSGRQGDLVKFNPLTEWSSAQVWEYIRDNDVPYNPLHEKGFVSIGCEPCTRPILPGEHERAGRWWWEESTKRECGLHIGNTKPPSQLD